MEKTVIDQVAENLMSLQPILTRTFSRSVKQLFDITPGMVYVMSSLKRNGVQNMSDIGRCQSMPKPHVTVIVDKLIEAGYAERFNDPNDRRVVNIKLTDKGLADFEAIKSSISSGLKEKLSTLSAEEIEQLAASTQHVRTVISSLLAVE
jgi:DNA-binding MarR family transcriptional regulator